MRTGYEWLWTIILFCVLWRAMIWSVENTAGVWSSWISGAILIGLLLTGLKLVGTALAAVFAG